MQIIPILLVVAVLAADAGIRVPGAPQTGFQISVFAALVAIPLCAFPAWIAVRLGLRGLDRRRTIGSLLRAERLLRKLPIVVVAAHAASLLFFDWLGAIRSVVGNLVVVDEVIAIIPPMIGLLLLRWIEFPLERRVREALLLRQLDAGEAISAPPSRRSFVLGVLRMQVAFAFAPILIIIAFAEGFDRIVRSEFVALPEWLEAVGSWAGIVIVLLSAPLLIEWFLDVRHPGPGGLRDDVESLARRHRIRIGRLLVWRTGNGVVNAAVMGVFPVMRRMLLTDGLLELLGSDEVRAVVAHELGHLRYRHLAWTIAAMAAVFLTAAALAGLALAVVSMAAMPAFMYASEIIASVLVIAVVVIAFGWISRRFEQQADAFAVRVLTEDPTLGRSPDGPGTGARGQVDPMVVRLMQETLERVSRLNGSDPASRSWRHGSIRQRQAALETLLGEDSRRLPIDRRVRTLKCLIIVALLVVPGVHVLLERVQAGLS